jgi:hypothetical protein
MMRGKKAGHTSVSERPAEVMTSPHTVTDTPEGVAAPGTGRDSGGRSSYDKMGRRGSAIRCILLPDTFSDIGVSHHAIKQHLRMNRVQKRVEKSEEASHLNEIIQ